MSEIQSKGGVTRINVTKIDVVFLRYLNLLRKERRLTELCGTTGKDRMHYDKIVKGKVKPTMPIIQGVFDFMAQDDIGMLEHLEDDRFCAQQGLDEFT